MQTTTKDSLIRIRPFVKDVEVHEEDLESMAHVAAMSAGLYAHAFCGMKTTPEILGVMQYVAGTLQARMVLFATKLTGNGGSDVIETAIDNVLSNHKYPFPQNREDLKAIEAFADMRVFAAGLAASGLAPGGPFARALRVHKSLIAAGELSVFKELYDLGPNGIALDSVKNFLNSKGMIHHFENYFQM